LLHNNDRRISGGNFDSGEKEIGDNFGFAHQNFISTPTQQQQQQQQQQERT